MKGYTVSASALRAVAICGRCQYRMTLPRSAAFTNETATCPCGESRIEVRDGACIHKTGAAEQARWETEPKCP